MSVQMKKLALVIGNAGYPYPGQLHNPINDACDMTNVLEELGFKVIKCTDLNLSEMMIYVSEYLRELDNYAVGLFYYAGHGIQIKGENYLVPIDYKDNNEDVLRYSCFGLSYLLDKLNMYRDKTNILILDACRTNPFGRSFRGTVKNEFVSIANPPQGTLISFSTSPDRGASDGVDENGLFTGVLKKHIKTPNIKVEELFKVVRTDVIELSAGDQIPWEHSSLIGDFYFNVKKIGHMHNITDEEIYNFIEDYFEKNKTSTDLNWEGMAYVEAQDKFNLTILEILRAHSRVANLKLNRHFTDNVIDEININYLTSWGFYYENFRWYYKGRYVRMGDVLPIDNELEKLEPEEGKAITVDFDVEGYIKGEYVFFKSNINLPDDTPIMFSLYSQNGNYGAQSKTTVKANEVCSEGFTNRGQLIDNGTYMLSITSPIHSVQPKKMQSIFGVRNRNLAGKHIKYSPIGGNTISYKITIIKKDDKLIIAK